MAAEPAPSSSPWAARSASSSMSRPATATSSQLLSAAVRARLRVRFLQCNRQLRRFQAHLFRWPVPASSPVLPCSAVLLCRHMRTCPHAHVHTCARARMHTVCTHAHVHTCALARMQACTQTHMHTCTHAVPPLCHPAMSPCCTTRARHSHHSCSPLAPPVHATRTTCALYSHRLCTVLLQLHQF